MSEISWSRIVEAATTGNIAVPGDLAGYLALGVTDAMSNSAAEVTENDVVLSAEGRVLVSCVRSGTAVGSASSVRKLMRQLLPSCSPTSPILTRIAEAESANDLDSLAQELQTALIPVNRAAARRALARLHREIARLPASTGREPQSGRDILLSSSSCGVAQRLFVEPKPRVGSTQSAPAENLHREVCVSLARGGLDLSRSAEPLPDIPDLVASVRRRGAGELSLGTNDDGANERGSVELVQATPEVSADQVSRDAVPPMVMAEPVQATPEVSADQVSRDAAPPMVMAEPVAMGDPVGTETFGRTAPIITEEQSVDERAREVTLVMAPGATTSRLEHTLRIDRFFASRHVAESIESVSPREICAQQADPSIPLPLVRLRRTQLPNDDSEYVQTSLSALAPDVEVPAVVATPSIVSAKIDVSSALSAIDKDCAEGVESRSRTSAAPGTPDLPGARYPTDSDSSTQGAEDLLRSDIPAVVAITNAAGAPFLSEASPSDERSPAAREIGLDYLGVVEAQSRVHDGISIHECVVCLDDGDARSLPAETQWASCEPTLTWANGLAPLALDADCRRVNLTVDSLPAASSMPDTRQSDLGDSDCTTGESVLAHVLDQTSLDTVVEVADEEIFYAPDVTGNVDVRERRGIAEESAAQREIHDHFVRRTELDEERFYGSVVGAEVWIDVDCSDVEAFEVVAPRTVTLEDLADCVGRVQRDALPLIGACEPSSRSPVSHRGAERRKPRTTEHTSKRSGRGDEGLVATGKSAVCEPAKAEPSTYYRVAERAAGVAATAHELVERFESPQLWSEGELCQNLRNLAGLDQTPGTSRVETVTPPPVEGAVRPRVEQLEPTRRLRRSAAVGLVLLVVGTGAHEFRESKASAMVVAPAVGDALGKICRSTIAVSGVYAGQRLWVRQAGDERDQEPKQVSNETAHFDGLRCGQDVELFVEMSRDLEWRRIPIPGVKLQPVGPAFRADVVYHLDKLAASPG